MYAKRADSYLKMKKPNAAIRDCDKQLALNPDSAKALRVRGPAYRYLRPDVTVAIDISPIDPTGRWTQDFTPYPDAIITPWRGYTAPISDEAFGALMSCDVVYSAETFYDPRLDQAAERRQIRTVRHVNPELFGGEYATAYWYPTSWKPVDLPPGPVMPLGIPDEWIRGEPAGPGERIGRRPCRGAGRFHAVGAGPGKRDAGDRRCFGMHRKTVPS